jgi:hypothetical protein
MFEDVDLKQAVMEEGMKRTSKCGIIYEVRCPKFSSCRGPKS